MPLMAAFFIYIALKTLIGRRPLVLSARYLFAVICLGNLPCIAATSLSYGLSMSADIGMIAWINPLISTAFLVFIWIQLKGYFAFAISDTYFREALLASASSLGFSIEETMSRLKINETGQEMQVAIQGWMGTAQLKSAGKGSNDTVKQIANGMTKYFKNTPGKMNYMTSYFYLFIGAAMVAFSIFIYRTQLFLQDRLIN